MIRFLLDTNVCIEMLRGSAPGVLRRLERCEVGQIAISTITLAELQHGVFKSSDPAGNLEVVMDFCAALEILPFDGRAAETYGRVRTALERGGTPIGPLDTLIAAHALGLAPGAAGCTLVTSNESEFQRVGGLGVENWMTAG